MTAARPTRDETNCTPQDAGSNHRLLGAAFRLYKTLISPALHAVAPSRCLYLPTCSEYAYTAIARFGVARGSWMAMRRFTRCHPWAAGGLDPVPEHAASTISSAANTASTIAGCSGPDHLP